MDDLKNKECEVCRVGAPQVQSEAMPGLFLQVSEWELIEAKEVKKLQRTYEFNNFQEALLFTNKIGELAETEGHHPAILTEWGRVTVTWWTHKIKGLHLNDFILAAKTDALVLK